jgi:uncharacterized protein YkwD
MKNVLKAFFGLTVFVASCQKESVTPDPADPATTDPQVVYNINKANLLQLVNDVRQKGCICGSTVMPPVAMITWNDQLAKAAYDHSKDMVVNNYFSHTGADGSDPGKRITAAGYAWKTYGENIASGYTSEQQVFNAWINSEGHCKNIMGANFKEMGAGRESNMWTQVFGAK